MSTDFWEISGWQVQGGQTFESAVPEAGLDHAPAGGARRACAGSSTARRVVVPGFQVRTAMQAARYLPHAVKLPAIEWLMRRR